MTSVNNLYHIWLWYKNKPTKTKTGVTLNELKEVIRHLRITIPAHVIEITKNDELPKGQTLFVCPVIYCAKCPKQFKSVCPMYKLFKSKAGKEESEMFKLALKFYKENTDKIK